MFLNADIADQNLTDRFEPNSDGRLYFLSHEKRRQNPKRGRLESDGQLCRRYPSLTKQVKGYNSADIGKLFTVSPHIFVTHGLST